jgi:hypothetical protein
LDLLEDSEFEEGQVALARAAAIETSAPVREGLDPCVFGKEAL